MKSYRLQVTPASQADLDDIYNDILNVSYSRRIARRYVDTIAQHIESLRDMPHYQLVEPPRLRPPYPSPYPRRHPH